MAHLHEILAVETDQRKVAAQVREETTAVFKNKQELFVETVKELRYFDEDEAAKLNADEVVAMTTTVTEKLDWLREIQARYLDTYLQKEASNQNARADVILNDAVFLSDVPVTALLGMEKYLKDLRNVFVSIPTLRPGAVWEADPKFASLVYRARDKEVVYITKKTVRAVILTQATDKHPAQIEKVPEDVKVAKRLTTTWSGFLTSHHKAALLGRVDQLIQAFKQARQRANETDIVVREMGADVFGFLYQDFQDYV